MVALLVAFAAFAVIWSEGLAGMRAALAAMAISLALLAYPAYLATKAYRLPWIYDITTDPIDPPLYDALAPLRAREDNPVAYAGLYAAEQQRQAYPDIGPLGTHATPENAYRAALAVMSKHRDSIVAPYWRVMSIARACGDAAKAASRPSPTRHFWASATTLSCACGRSPTARASTCAPHRATERFDFGTNAARIRRLLNDIEELDSRAKDGAAAANGAAGKEEDPAGQARQAEEDEEPFFR